MEGRGGGRQGGSGGGGTCQSFPYLIFPPSLGLSLCLFSEIFSLFLSDQRSGAEMSAASLSFLLLHLPSGRREKQKAAYLVFTLITCRTKGQTVNELGRVHL